MGAAPLMLRFAGLGAVWLLSFPLEVWCIAPLLPPTHRHLSVTAATLVCQGGALAAMLPLFLGAGRAGATFVRASTIGAMGDLGDLFNSHKFLYYLFMN